MSTQISTKRLTDTVLVPLAFALLYLLFNLLIEIWIAESWLASFFVVVRRRVDGLVGVFRRQGK